LGALLKTPPRAYGWCRTRWSGATLAAQLKVKHGIDGLDHGIGHFAQ
jgi:hypothetical protein